MRFLSLTELGQMTEARQEAVTLSRAVEELRQPAQMWLEPVNRADACADRGRLWPRRSAHLAGAGHRLPGDRGQGRRFGSAHAPVSPATGTGPTCRRGGDACGSPHETFLGTRCIGRRSFACSSISAARQRLGRRSMTLPWATSRRSTGTTSGCSGCAWRVRPVHSLAMSRPRASCTSSSCHSRDDMRPVTRKEVSARLIATSACWQQRSATSTMPSVTSWRRSRRSRRWARGRGRPTPSMTSRRFSGDEASPRILRGPRSWIDPRSRRRTRSGWSLAARIAGLGGSTAEDREGRPGAVTSPGPGTFRQEGDYWTIEYEGDAFRVRDAKGLHHLARLLAAPGREIHSLELAGSGTATAGGNATHRLAVDPALVVSRLGDAGPALDAEAKAAYRTRLDDLREELAEAEDWNDPERVARLQAEIGALTHELAAAIGLGGRDRPAASSAERARVSVTRAIRSILARIAAQDPELGAHLEATIRTGTFCSYTPDPRAPIAWRL